MLRQSTRFLATAAVVFRANAVCAAAPARPVFVPGELIVQFRPEVTQQVRLTVLRSARLHKIAELLGTKALHVSPPKGADILKVAAALRKRPEIEYAEPNYYRYLEAVPNDPRFGEMYGLDNTGQTGGTPDADIDAPEAWDIAFGSASVVVADLDSGMELTHADLAANLYTNPGEVAGNGVDPGASAIECPYNFTTTTTGPTAGVTAGRSLTLPGTGTPWATTATEAPRHD